MFKVNNKYINFKHISHLFYCFYCYFKACVRYFSLFLKDKCISSLFRTKYIEKKFNLQLFFFPLFHKDLFSPGLPRATRTLETSCLEKITACVIETMLVTLRLVQMNKAQREGNWTNPSTNQDKHHERSSNICYALNSWERMPLNIKTVNPEALSGPNKILRWSFLRKKLTAFSCSLFL